jgi:hypothetical protein
MDNFVAQKILVPFYTRMESGRCSGTRKGWVAVRGRTQRMGLLAEMTIELNHDRG